MRAPPQIRWLPDGRRLHLHDGPIDLVVQGFGTPDALHAAYEAAARRFRSVLDELCAELPSLRQAAGPAAPPLSGEIAKTMGAVVAPHACNVFITPMAAVAGAVADAVLRAMRAAAPLDRAFVNNGGDIALCVPPGASLRLALADRPDRPSLFGEVDLHGEDGVAGVATSGWRGRSFSLGIADSATVLAASAAAADAAATVLANAVDLPDHPAVHRVPASDVQPDSDLGARLVTRNVGILTQAEIVRALDGGVAAARRLLVGGLIVGAVFRLRGETRVVGSVGLRADAPQRAASVPSARELVHA